jgi:hypothetical protein
MLDSIEMIAYGFACGCAVDLFEDLTAHPEYWATALSVAILLTGIRFMRTVRAS